MQRVNLSVTKQLRFSQTKTTSRCNYVNNNQTTTLETIQPSNVNVDLGGRRGGGGGWRAKEDERENVKKEEVEILRQSYLTGQRVLACPWRLRDPCIQSGLVRPALSLSFSVYLSASLPFCLAG